MNARRIARLALAGLFPVISASGADGIANAKSTLEQYVETRQLISEEKSNWKVEKQILRESKAVLEQELETLKNKIADYEDAADDAASEREKLESENKTLSAASEVVEARLGSLEAELKAIMARFPQPLANSVQPLKRRIPDDPEKARPGIGERVQNLVGILNEAEKFNDNVKITSEVRELADGSEVEVRTLYWGLSAAYFADANGTHAGVGHPAEDGWQWPEHQGAAENIARLLSVYENQADIQFVEVPAKIR